MTTCNRITTAQGQPLGTCIALADSQCLPFFIKRLPSFLKTKKDPSIQINPAISSRHQANLERTSTHSTHHTTSSTSSTSSSALSSISSLYLFLFLFSLSLSSSHSLSPCCSTTLHSLYFYIYISLCFSIFSFSPSSTPCAFP